MFLKSQFTFRDCWLEASLQRLSVAAANPSRSNLYGWSAWDNAANFEGKLPDFVKKVARRALTAPAEGEGRLRELLDFYR